MVHHHNYLAKIVLMKATRKFYMFCSTVPVLFLQCSSYNFWEYGHEEKLGLTSSDNLSR